MVREFVLTHYHGVDAAREAMESHLDQLRQDTDLLTDSHAGTGPQRRRRTLRIAGPDDYFAEHLRALQPGVILEERVFFEPHSTKAIVGANRFKPRAAAPPPENTMQVTVKGDGQPLAGAEVTLLCADGSMHSKHSDAAGQATLHWSNKTQPVVVGAYPAHSFWSACVAQPTDSVELNCEPLTADGPLAWWHREMGIDTYQETAGQGIRIGVIGTGVSPHPNLTHVTRVDDKSDLSTHGTHVCGIIAARPTQPGDYAGIAPGATVLTRRVFELDDQGEPTLPDQATLADAIEDFAGLGFDGHFDGPHHVDLINMSLGSTKPADIAHNAIRDAANHGTLCFCSAGNTGGAVEFPAAFPETLAIGGLGKPGWGPKNSITVFMSPPANSESVWGSDSHGHPLFVANFSSRGRQLSCTGPADGIISTVPCSKEVPDAYGVADGTSLSTPATCALAARVLAESDAYRAAPRDASRTDLARKLLRQSCTDLGLDDELEGSGLPFLKPTPKADPATVDAPQEPETKS